MFHERFTNSDLDNYNLVTFVFFHNFFGKNSSARHSELFSRSRNSDLQSKTTAKFYRKTEVVGSKISLAYMHSPFPRNRTPEVLSPQNVWIVIRFKKFSYYVFSRFLLFFLHSLSFFQFE